MLLRSRMHRHRPALPRSKGATGDLRTPGETHLLRLDDNIPRVTRSFPFSLGIGKQATEEAVVRGCSLQVHLCRTHGHRPALSRSKGGTGDLRSSGEMDLLRLDDNITRVTRSFRFSCGIGENVTGTPSMSSAARTVTAPPFPGPKVLLLICCSPGETHLLRLDDNLTRITRAFRFSLGIGKQATEEAVVWGCSLQVHLCSLHRHRPALSRSKGAAGDLLLPRRDGPAVPRRQSSPASPAPSASPWALARMALGSGCLVSTLRSPPWPAPSPSLPSRDHRCCC